MLAQRAQFEFKQGLDIRLMTAKRARLLKQARYCGEFIFAFDQLKDRKQVEKGLATFRKHLPTTGVKCYVFCGFEDLTEDDIASVFERVKVLWKHGCLAYVMRHENHRHAHRIYRGLYVQLARWCNQPEFQRTLSFREFCERSGGKAERDALAFQQRHSQIAKKYFGMRYSAV